MYSGMLSCLIPRMAFLYSLNRDPCNDLPEEPLSAMVPVANDNPELPAPTGVRRSGRVPDQRYRL